MNENDKQAEPVAQPYAYVYEFDSGMFGIHRSFSSNERNGSKPSRVVPVYTHPTPAVMQEPVGEIQIEDMGKPFNAARVRVHFYKEVPPVGAKIYTEAPAVAVNKTATSYRLVPVEPTQAMKAAGQKRIDELANDGIKRYWQDIYGEGYKAMIDIAPTDPAAAINEETKQEIWRLTHVLNDQVHSAGPAISTDLVKIYCGRIFAHLTNSFEELFSESAQPFGRVTVVRRLEHQDQHFFYPWPHPPYLDNAAECHTVYTHPAQPVQPAGAQCRGYALLGTGNYLLNHSDDFHPELGAELIITLATEKDKEGSRQIGETRDNPDHRKPIQPDDMVVRIGFLNERGLFALENQLAEIRKQFFADHQAPAGAHQPAEVVRELVDSIFEMIEHFERVDMPKASIAIINRAGKALAKAKEHGL